MWKVECLLGLYTLQLIQMASRCISTLNDLDKISDRIYYKHSKVSFVIRHDHDGKVR